MINPDVNLIVYAYDSRSPFHSRCKEWWEQIHDGSESVGIPWEVSLGFMRLVTRPRVMLRPITVERALVIVATWFEHGEAEALHPGERHFARLKYGLREVGVGNKLVADAHLASIAMEYRAVLYSNDRDFERFSGLQLQNPLA